MRKIGRSFSRTWGTYKGGAAPVIDATPVWQSPEAKSLSTAQGGSAFSLTFVATSPVGNALTYSLGPASTIPPGLTLSPSGVLSGTLANPSSSTYYTYTIRASDGSVFADRNFSFNVVPSTAQDPYNQYVVGLYHFDGSLADSSSNGLNMTTTGPAVTTADSKFGGSCLKLGPSGHTSIPTSSMLRMPGDFTIEFWLKTYQTQTTFSVIASQQAGTSGGDSGFEIDNYYGTNGSTSGSTASGAYCFGGRVYSTTPTNDGVWHHHALVRSGSTATYYVDGVAGTGTVTGIATSAAIDFGSVAGMRWGGNGSDSASSVLYAYLDELRITNGIARYISNFTPPTAPFGYP